MAKKALGQHFLVDLNIARKICDALSGGVRPGAGAAADARTGADGCADAETRTRVAGYAGAGAEARTMAAGSADAGAETRANAAGYAGAELIRLVLGHPEFELAAITSNADAGQPLSAVYPSFTGVSDLVFTTHDAPELKNCDAVFLAVPHTAAMAQVPALLASGVSCFDLSADYRLNDASVFEAWYAAEHTSPELLKTRAFGLPELFCQDLETAASDHADGKPVLYW